MISFLLIVFWSCIFTIFYTYLGFGICLALAVRIMKRREMHIDKAFDPFPKVSFLIAAYNEEKVIRAKIDNILNLDYPCDRMTIYVISDSSTDRTHAIVSSYAHEQVRLIVSTERRGKTFCENLGLKQIDNDFIVFTDASTMLEAHCLQNLMRHFSAREVGCVSTVDRSIHSDVNRGENLYVRYEMAIRALEGRFDSLVGLSGSCYAARRELCTELPDHVTRDFALPLIARGKGFISIDDPEAVCYVNPTQDSKIEFQRKVRTFTNGISTLIYQKNLLNICRHGRFAGMLWSHKVLRWLLPFFFIGAFLTNLALVPWKRIFRLFMIAQILGYLAAFIGHLSKSSNIAAKFTRIILFFCMTNLASLMAWYNYATNKRMAKWEPTKRQQVVNN